MCIFQSPLPAFLWFQLLFLSFCFLVSSLLHWHSSVVYHDIPSWTISPTKLPGACLLFPAFSFFLIQIPSCLCSIKSMLVSSSFNSLHCSGPSAWFTVSRLPLSFAFPQHTHTERIQSHQAHVLSECIPRKGFPWKHQVWKAFLSACSSTNGLTAISSRNNWLQNSICIVNSAEYRK